MKTKHFINFIIISFLIGVSAVLIAKVLAQETEGLENIQYPVKELGNCKDKAACKAHCDKPENIEACINFAEKNNLMPKKEIERAKNFIMAGSKGPGDCRNKDECENYCNNIDHIDECIAFGEENNLIPPEELEEAKKVQAAIKRGVKPPPCGNKKACDTYCEDPNHMEECISFGKEAGFIQGKEFEDAQKMLTALKKGVKPPPCKGKKECDKYCSAPENMEVCMTFAIEAGFIGEKEKEDAQKMLTALKKGVKPPACQGKEECDVYCAEKEHFEECLNFAEAAGFMSPEDAVMARKTGGKSPGNCKGKEECEAFCNNPDNQETCFNFAKENGLIPEEDLKRMEEGKQQFKESMTQMPPEAADCVKSLVGEEMFEKLKSGAAMPPKEIGEQMRTCFEKTMRPPQDGMTPPGQAGPGGCKTPEECESYCKDNPDECQKFQPGPGAETPGGQIMPQQAGPGGCKGPEECQVYCESHPDECKNLGPGGDEQSGQFTPGTGPSGPTGPEGQPGQLPPIGPTGCQSPEECQQMQNMIAPQPPMEQQPPVGQQPPINQQPPAEGTMPPPPSSETPPPSTETPPPSSEVTPPPSETPPPPSGAITPKTLLRFLLNIFFPASRHR